MPLPVHVKTDSDRLYLECYSLSDLLWMERKNLIYGFNAAAPRMLSMAISDKGLSHSPTAAICSGALVDLIGSSGSN